MESSAKAVCKGTPSEFLVLEPSTNPSFYPACFLLKICSESSKVINFVQRLGQKIVVMFFQMLPSSYVYGTK